MRKPLYIRSRHAPAPSRAAPRLPCKYWLTHKLASARPLSLIRDACTLNGPGISWYIGAKGPTNRPWQRASAISEIICKAESSVFDPASHRRAQKLSKDGEFPCLALASHKRDHMEDNSL